MNHVAHQPAPRTIRPPSFGGTSAASPHPPQPPGRLQCDRPAGPHPHRHRGSTLRGFTLIELLVVIGIVGILASLLLPALAKARQSAGTARCTGNLRQFILAAQMYWDDHEGAAFPYRGHATNGGDVYWFGWLQRGDEGTRAFDPTAGALWPYLEGRGVETCPALPLHGPRFKPKAAGGGACGYGYNLNLAGLPAQSPIRPLQTARPCELAVFADAAQINDFQAPASPEHPLLEEFYYLSTQEPTVHFRHRERATVAFADGHVTRHRALSGSYDARLPEALVGRLAPAYLTPP